MTDSVPIHPQTADDVGRLRVVLLKHPRDAFRSQATIDAQWRALHYTAPPDFKSALTEYDALVALLWESHCEIVFAGPDDRTGLDSLYVRDAAVVTPAGVVLGNMGKEARRGEPSALADAIERSGRTVLGRITDPGRLEGGDLIQLDARTIAVGEGYRTNATGIEQLCGFLDGRGIDVINVPLPHWSGPDDVMHLMSLFSPLDHDLALVYSRLLPVPFRELLLARGIALVEVPDAEFETMGTNVLAVAPRDCIMLDGNPLTRARLEEHGVRVRVYKGDEISRKGAGGPTCLTRPLLRD